MSGLPGELRELIESGPLAHLSTINADGSPQVTVIWIGLDGDDVVSGHMGRYLKVRNVERDPRVVLSFEAPRDRTAFLNPYVVLRARATVEPGEAAWDLLNRLAKVYLSPVAEFPAPKGPGYVLRYSVEHIGGVGPWVGLGAVNHIGLEPVTPSLTRGGETAALQAFRTFASYRTSLPLRAAPSAKTMVARAFFSKPSIGLEPMTPSLPWKCSTN